MDQQALCSICDTVLINDTDTVVSVKERGLKKLIEKSIEKEDRKSELWLGKIEVSFHEKCRKSYPMSTSSIKRKSKLSTDPSSSHFTSSVVGPSILPASTSTNLNFDFVNLCFFCKMSLDRKHKRVHLIANKYTQDQILDIARRQNDEFSTELIKRIKDINLVDCKASYHHKCYVNFNKLVKEPKISTLKEQTARIFNQICKHIEESCQYTFSLRELKDIMGDDPLSHFVLFRMLKEKYKDDIFISHHRGKEPMIYYKTFDISKICSDWFTGDGDEMDDLQKQTILNVAVKILRNEIIKHDYRNTSYPPASSFLDDVVSSIPPLLTSFLGNLLCKDNSDQYSDNFIVRDSIAHSIVSYLRPKQFISSLQLAVGSYVHRKTGSRLIVDLLSKLGVCASYYHIQLHEACTVINPPALKINSDKPFAQFVFDNTDHNAKTLDGKETFHCLGGIVAYTPESSISFEENIVKFKKMPKPQELVSKHVIPQLPYGSFNTKALQSLEFIAIKNIPVRKSPVISTYYSAYLWAKFFEVKNVPSWKGYMEVLSSGIPYTMSQIVCLPFINGPPSNLTTLNSSLHYAAAETRKLNRQTCFVTYDQPLYAKALSIVQESNSEELKNVVVRLGGFHLLMSYLGAIGYIMSESGIEDLWTTVYAGDSVKKMLTGHAYARALRAHIMSFTALGIIICRSLKPSDEFQDSIKKFFGTWDSEPPLLTDCDDEPVITDMCERFVQQLAVMEKNGPTSKLWIQYFKSIIIALQFLEAERLGNWELHLQSVKEMLPFFHASGHYPYAKYAQIYLQQMADLELIMDPGEYDEFTKEGFFTIRRSEKAWAGIWSDMVIEQTLNRFFGTDLKHGRGVTSSVVTRYLVAMPSAFNIMECLETYCKIESSNSEQHVDISRSRITKDEVGIKKFLFWLDERNPFEVRTSLVSLSTGIIGGPTINCHNAVEVGLQGIATMVGKNIDNVSLSNAFKVKTLANAKSGMHIGDDFVAVDSFLLIQRISVFFHGNVEETRNALKYELSPFPLSLFDEHGLMRKTPKSELYNVFQPYIQSPALISGSGSIFVIDGGWLLHSYVWPHGKKYSDICNLYYSYLIKHFGSNVTVIFDGYSKETIGIKSYERYRRKEKCVAADVEISEDNLVTLTQKKFLSNIANKKQFVNLLSNNLQNRGISTNIASEDADLLIVKTAIDLKRRRNQSVTIVGNDIDLLIILISLVSDEEVIYFYKMTPGKQANVIYSTEYDKNLKPFLLFAHAFAGCDTTSAIFKKGKKSIISLLKKKPDLQALISVFYESNRSIEELYAVSEKIIFHLYGQSITDELTLGELRYRIFSLSAAAFKKEVILASLPPTESALREHTKRVYYQIQQWLGNNLNPDDWGWRRTLFMMIPIMSNAEPAPKELIDKVSCSCKTNCLSARCGCKKSGLKCNKFCKSCQGQSCDNASARSFNLEDDENEDKEDEERDDSDDENDDDGNVYEDENDGEEETTVEDGEQENEAICTGRKTVKNTRSKVSTQKNQLCISKM
ncbi:uncharacterized protein LOC123686399 isoform X2 [Harmonia axyridis]|uniref:uncharacterized protein LOC123681184 isoform X2 n=3 Tax=Harmonia axyridis TaxID=115357 RepID=UPI001E278896|nr:uncharacterized protein LOC123681184 isoform X2 [Harmonia axyridis]XP_045482442.1 uncharacterized protein LOC123686399 isoform X2 [Harmonia axyridis]